MVSFNLAFISFPFTFAFRFERDNAPGYPKFHHGEPHHPLINSTGISNAGNLNFFIRIWYFYFFLAVGTEKTVRIYLLVGYYKFLFTVLASKLK